MLYLIGSLHIIIFNLLHFREGELLPLSFRKRERQPYLRMFMPSIIQIELKWIMASMLLARLEMFFFATNK